LHLVRSGDLRRGGERERPVKIGIVGPGAIGLTFAAQLARAHDVVVLARRGDVVAVLARDGIGLADERGIRYVRVRATVDPRAFADRDAVIVAVKAYATGDALAPLRGVLRRGALIASIQNGLGNVELARVALPGARVVAGSTTHGAVRLADGCVRPVNCGTTTFARDDGASPTSDELAAAFLASGLEARVVDDAHALLWRKLVVNAALNPLCALAGRANGAVTHDPDLEVLARALTAEAAAVARADGAEIPEPWEVVRAAAGASAANENSMLQDLDAGRPTEIDAISGAVVRHAQAYGLAVPLTETMLRLVRARERAAAGRAGANR
jgi:2-dehydropantoate 2-reductase